MSNALVKNNMVRKRDVCCFLHYSCSSQIEKITHMVDVSKRNQHFDSLYTLTARFCSQDDTCIDFTYNTQEVYPSVVVAIASVALVLVQDDGVGIFQH
ncbi:hypothetical protein DPMN_090308 [Dreissena polymorpha]|uniref:Uncharacterized protein n=1 Tax=Dreissena polymorpha TaxID=45954 RepID=A0A9D4KXH2_DREPO|nr:hypothetical protein DPMN_090308 [Dreissena polymorpha]